MEEIRLNVERLGQVPIRATRFPRSSKEEANAREVAQESNDHRQAYSNNLGSGKCPGQTRMKLRVSSDHGPRRQHHQTRPVVAR